MLWASPSALRTAKMFCASVASVTVMSGQTLFIKHWTEASLHPLDGQLNLPVEKYSHEVRRRVALEAAKGAFEAGVETLATYTGAHVPKRQFEELVVRAAQDFDAFYQARHAQARAAPATANSFGPPIR